MDVNLLFKQIMYFLLALTVAGGGLMLSWLIHRSVLTPMGMYAATWGLMVFLFSINGIVGVSFISISPYGWFLITFSIAAFVFGAGLGAAMFRFTHDDTEATRTLEFITKRHPPILWIFLFVGIFGVAIKWILLYAHFDSIVQAVTGIGELRTLALEGEFSYPVYARLSVLLLFPVLLFSAIRSVWSRRYAGLTVVVLALIFLSDFTIGARGPTVFGFTLATVAYVVTTIHAEDVNLRVSVGKFSIASFVMLAFVNIILFARAGVLGTIGPIEYITDSARTIYFYATGPLPAFGWIIGEGSMSSYPGAYTFGGIYRVFNYAGEVILGSGFVPRPPKPWAPIPIGFNSFPHLWALYSDFGAFGMGVFLFGFGLLSQYAYTYYRVNPSMTALVVTIIAFLFIGWSPRDITTFWVSFWIVAILGIALAVISDRANASV